MAPNMVLLHVIGIGIVEPKDEGVPFFGRIRIKLYNEFPKGINPRGPVALLLSVGNSDLISSASSFASANLRAKTAMEVSSARRWGSRPPEIS